MKGKYTYRVTGVFDKGESLASNEAFIDLEQTGAESITAATVTINAVKGGVQVNGAAEQTISIFTLEGSLVSQTEGTGSDTVALPAGVYVSSDVVLVPFCSGFFRFVFFVCPR